MLLDEDRCPQCDAVLDARHIDSDVCLLSVLGGILEARGHSSEDVLELLFDIDIDALWCDVGPILDGIEKGKYDVVYELAKPDNENDSRES